MTRINCVPVAVLSDSHLLAEYKEITRPFTKMTNRMSEGASHSRFLRPTVTDTKSSFLTNYCIFGYVILIYSKNCDGGARLFPVLSNSTLFRTVFTVDSLARLSYRQFKNTIDDYK